MDQALRDKLQIDNSFMPQNDQFEGKQKVDEKAIQNQDNS